MSPDQRFVLEHQAKTWLNAMRRARVSRYGPESKPLPAWEELTVTDRNILMASMNVAIKAGQPENIEKARQRALEAQQPS